jgi:hypothetical protein
VVTWQRPTEAGKPKSVLIRVQACGRHSEMYYPGAFLKGERPPMPQYRILDAQGKLLASGRVSGKGPIYDFTWLPPPAFAGKFRVELEPVMGPFTWKVLGIEGEVK